MDFDLSQLQKSGFEFLDLEGACKAEIEILHNMLFNSQGSPQAQKLFHLKPNPNGEGNFLVDMAPLSDESDMQGDTQEEVADTDQSVDSHIDDVGVEAAEETTNPMENGPVVTISPLHQVIPHESAGTEEVPVQNEIGSNVMNPPQHHNMRSYYQPHHVQVHGNSQVVGPTGPGPAHMGLVNQGPQIPVSMYHQMQMIQTHGGYGMIPNGPPHGHSHPQHGSQAHAVYFVQEPLSPDAVHLQNPGQSHHKNHHDPHHSVVSHSANTSGLPNGPGYRKNHRRNDGRLRQEDGLMNMKNYTYYTHSPYGQVHYYSPQQQMAQNVTGPPIIMTHNGPHPANMYGSPYQHQPSGPHMYAQPQQGNEMDQHPGNMGPAGSHAHEIPYIAQQHQPVTSYHSAIPPHGNRNYGNRSSSIPPPEPPTEQPDLPTSTSNESEVSQASSETTFQPSSTGRNGNVNAPSYTSEKGRQDEEVAKEEVNRGSSSPNQTEEPVELVVNGEISPVVTCSLTATSNTMVAAEPQRERSKEKSGNSFSKNNKVSADGKSVDKNKSEQQVQQQQSPQQQQLTNGEVGKIEKDKLDKTRDKESADVITNTELVKSEVKSKSGSSVNSNNSRSVNATNTSVAYPSQGKHVKEADKVEESCKETEGSSSQDFPQLAKMPNGSMPVAPVKGRSWASIASSKTPNLSAMNTPHTNAPVAQNNDHTTNPHLEDVNFPHPENKYMPVNDSSANASNVPIIQEEKPTVSIDAPPIDSSSLTDENDPIALRLGEFLASYSLDHHSLALSPRGLCNQSNFCYINATLQALLACPPFVNLFRSLREILSKKPCKATPIIQSVFDFVSEFEPMLRGNNNKRDRRNDAFCTGSNLEPTGIRKVLGLLEGSTFKVEGRQEDAEEFLSHLLNALHDEMIKVMKWAENRKERLTMKPAVAVTQVNTTQINGRLEEGIAGEEDDEDQWQVMGPKNKGCLTRKTAISKSPISETFLGQMCSALHRMNPTSTNFKSATLQPFYTLQLDIQNENIRSVRDALEGLSAKEELSGIVSNSGVEMEAWRQLSLEDLPMVLILHLKRFVYEKSGNKIQKVDKKLDFGIDLEIGKDLLSVSSKTKYMLKQRQYKLFAVVYHDGEEAHKGHYVADCFHPSGGSMWGQCGWLRFDDTAVKQIPENQMLTSLPPRVPYLLYYRRADTLLSHVTPNQQQQQPKKERL